MLELTIVFTVRNIGNPDQSCLFDEIQCKGQPYMKYKVFSFGRFNFGRHGQIEMVVNQ